MTTTRHTTRTVRTSTSVRRAVTTAVLAGAAVLTAAPAYAVPAPLDPTGDGSGGQQTAQQNKAQIEHAEQAQANHQTAPRPAGTSDPSDPSVPLTVLALIGGGLVSGAAGFTVYRYRHHRPAEAATA